MELRGQDQNPLVRGKAKPPLSFAEYNVVQALLNAGESGQSGLTKDKLDEKSGHTEARKILKRLRVSDPDWAAVIRFPGKAGRGGCRLV